MGASNEKDPDEVYLAMIGDCGGGEEGCSGCGKSMPLIFSVKGEILIRPEQIKTAEGMTGQRIGPDGPVGKMHKLLVLNRGLSSEKLFIVREVLHEPTEIDAICRVSNLIGDSHG